MSNFKIGEINGIIIKDLIKNVDDRGWLIELFRKDLIDEELFPEMSYISLTYPGIVRGPHEHSEQTDYFCFMGPSIFKLVLWDNRKKSETYNNKMSLDVGENNPKIVIVPPGIVHAYKNIGDRSGIVINLPNKLYAGWGKKEKVDEIRYEGNPRSPFRME
ncbi:MAG: dTDP-4-dehydrorhamnose 3,5-epimerase family protein [Candidatus Methanoperedens sp.]|nr:dTDP-4-dehydrorhamnose 3,5-epimerase family protein [Candidatus Methanoperedens sp.]MCZ7395945.1 dTDP-4-dehydrorhamnose 3,5-epimerase family protein [Candidatus Methanoperedens sp.]